MKDNNNNNNDRSSLPPNYVSLADLQKRWINQKTNKTDKVETQPTQELNKKDQGVRPNPNPNFKSYRDFKQFREVKVNVDNNNYKPMSTDEKVGINGGGDVKKRKKKQWRKNKKTNDETRKETEILGKEGNQVSERGAVDDQTAEIGLGFDKLNVKHTERRSNRRWTKPGFGGHRHVYRREMESMRRENGLVWVKKGVVPEHSE